MSFMFLWVELCNVGSFGLCFVSYFPVDCVMCCSFIWIVLCVCCRLSCGLFQLLWFSVGCDVLVYPVWCAMCCRFL